MRRTKCSVCPKFLKRVKKTPDNLHSCATRVCRRALARLRTQLDPNRGQCATCPKKLRRRKTDGKIQFCKDCASARFLEWKLNLSEEERKARGRLNRFYVLRKRGMDIKRPISISELRGKPFIPKPRKDLAQTYVQA